MAFATGLFFCLYLLRILSYTVHFLFMPSHCSQDLSLDRNQLTQLPSAIGLLTSLRRLSVRHNRLRTLPSEIQNCRSLLCLRASRNQLQYLPSEMRHRFALLDVGAFCVVVVVVVVVVVTAAFIACRRPETQPIRVPCPSDDCTTKGNSLTQGFGRNICGPQSEELGQTSYLIMACLLSLSLSLSLSIRTDPREFRIDY
jgi:Leucine-rich repeat (LRR) protein